MSIIRYNVHDYAPTSFSNLVDRFFNDSLARSGGSTFVPKADIFEDEKSYQINLVAPGMKKDDFKIELDDKFLTISGERKFNRESKDGNFHIVESQYGSFSRSFTLPDIADAAKITASYNNGVLEIEIPKDSKKLLKQTISVK
ncbi:MAG TPA: Hsp20/alpha crystallin family protein [Cyclobacteriaceae bacterium]|nr:Hsp20/alpha crystallin family protein [Cyclobacteriaceae bacterium]